MKPIIFFLEQTYRIKIYVNGSATTMNNVKYNTLKDFYNIVKHKTADSISLNHVFIKVSSIDMFYVEIETLDKEVEQIELARLDSSNNKKI